MWHAGDALKRKEPDDCACVLCAEDERFEAVLASL
jgi:hypothetical protein